MSTGTISYFMSLLHHEFAFTGKVRNALFYSLHRDTESLADKSLYSYKSYFPTRQTVIAQYITMYQCSCVTVIPSRQWGSLPSRHWGRKLTQQTIYHYHYRTIYHYVSVQLCHNHSHKALFCYIHSQKPPGGGTGNIRFISSHINNSIHHFPAMNVYICATLIYATFWGTSKADIVMLPNLASRTISGILNVSFCIN